MSSVAIGASRDREGTVTAAASSRSPFRRTTAPALAELTHARAAHCTTVPAPPAPAGSRLVSTPTVRVGSRRRAASGRTASAADTGRPHRAPPRRHAADAVGGRPGGARPARHGHPGHAAAVRGVLRPGRSRRADHRPAAAGTSLGGAADPGGGTRRMLPAAAHRRDGRGPGAARPGRTARHRHPLRAGTAADPTARTCWSPRGTDSPGSRGSNSHRPPGNRGS